MKKSGFKPKSLEQVKKKQASKIASKLEKLKNDTKSRVKPKNSSEAKNKPHKPKRKKRSDRKKLEDKIWEECKRIIRARYPNICYTCNAQGLEGSNWQTGHGKPKGALPIQFKYDLRNLRPQCMNDNIHLGGASDIFIAKLEKEKNGLAFLKESCRKTPEGWIIKKEGGLVGKEATFFLENLLEEYKNICK